MTDDLVTWLRAALLEDERMTASEPDDWRTRGTYTDHFTAEWVLADIAAKRAILDLHDRDGGHECPAGSDEWGDHTSFGRSCRTLDLLASAYADRPGYRQEWRP